uniref:F-box domain-containing protein n=1 Tax=Lactuca sativa TaxID=4236 RepID=A0A9R1UVF4_LACSA|nr:hypothetical protein LSAT_V11C800438240 [Lactuca sativa]
MKRSKLAKASKLKDGVDMISNLSDDILHLILSRLPTTEEVIRTSILSTRWRYLHTSFSYSSLDIDFSRTLKSPTRFEMNKFKEFMNRVLANKSLNLVSFRLCCSNYDNLRTLGRWIEAAVTRNIKLLHLMVCPIVINQKKVGKVLLMKKIH